MAAVYRLKVTQVEQVCCFELTWGRGRQLSSKLPYPEQLAAQYQSWQRIYLNYYQSALQDGPLNEHLHERRNNRQDGLRGKAVVSGQLVAKADWHPQLVQAEAKLLYEFHQWLRSSALFDIRSELGKKAAARPVNDSASSRSGSRSNSRAAAKAPFPGLDLLITCDPISLGRLPWEAWELNAEFGSTQPIRIARLPVNVREAVSAPMRSHTAARILVILGDDTGLDFAEELNAIATLKRLAHIKVIGWQPGVETTELKQFICNTIQSAAGWDMLLFFGHSNEANAVGGQIAIAPHTTLSLRELDPYLRKAKTNGLKFALFNSCKGLDIAISLIDIGLNQVAVMREPIHNRVAQSFLIPFMQSLARFEDVHTALQKATQALRAESNLTYPSAHLVPSLFRHSDAVLFRLQPVGLRAQVRSLLPPTRWQKAALLLLTCLSLLSPVTDSLIARRLWVQALHRNLTRQISNTPPPVLLVQIDEQSIREGIPSGDPYPMDRNYLSQIVEQLSVLETSVIGIDYLLDRPQAENDATLSGAIASAIQQDAAFVFGAILEPDAEIGVREDIASLDRVMQGHTHVPRWYLRVPQSGDNCFEKCPFAYVLALVKTAEPTGVTSAISSDVTNDIDLRRRLLLSSKTQNQDTALSQLYQLRLPILSSLSRLWDQRWLHPLLDLSLPPEQVYSSLSAYQLLNTPTDQLRTQFDWQNQVVIVASGGYSEAGTGANSDFVTPPPPGINYWFYQQNEPPEKFTGGEANAYAVHHFLQQHYVVPIPDSWLIGLNLVVGAGMVLLFSRGALNRSRQRLILIGLSVGAGMMTLQLYVSAQLLVPWLLPTAAVWVFCWPTSSALSNRPSTRLPQ